MDWNVLPVSVHPPCMYIWSYDPFQLDALSITVCLFVCLTIPFVRTAIPLKPLPLDAEVKTDESSCIC